MTGLAQSLIASLRLVDPQREHFSGFILSRLSRAVRGSEITILDIQHNHVSGVHQARVKLEGDDTSYVLTIGPDHE